MISFENFATSDYDARIDEKIENELKIANIPVIKLPTYLSAEVKASCVGYLNGFTFWRAWRYWVCKGNMPLDTAQKIYAEHKDLNIRAGGHAGNLPPERMTRSQNGSAEKFVPYYHIDTQDGLCELAKAIIENNIKSE